MTIEKTATADGDDDSEMKPQKYGHDEESPSFAWPTVVAVVVTHNPGDWLEQCLSSIANQEYPDLTTLVVDVCSDTDVTQRVAQAMPTAFVRRSEEDINFAQAINTAVDSIEGATYVLICHDDVILESGAIAEMVEEAFRSNASIVGPKMIDAAVPDQLLEVGGMIDRFGVPFSGIEFGEVDQGQHDGVRDVFFVSSAAMLVRADLFRALGGFDVHCFPGAEDIDLAWRAHLVSARVLVQPEAVVRHHKTSDRQRKARTSATAIVARHRMRAVLKNASAVSLAWILPLAFILHSVEGIVWLLRADPRRAWLLFSGWIWNIRHLGDTRSERAKIQKTREVSDRVISTHQIGGSARIRRFFTSLIENRQLKKFTNASRVFATERYSRRTRETPIYLAAMAVYFIAVRSLIINGISGVGEFSRWPSFSRQVEALLHGGLPVSHEPMLSSTFGRLIALCLTFLCGNNQGLAQTVFVLSLIPLGGYGVRLLLKERAMGPRSIAFAAITYGTFALGMHAFSQGDLGSLVLLAGLPYFLRALSNRNVRQVGVVAAVMIAFYPAAIVVCLVIGAAFVFMGDKSETDALTESKTHDFLQRSRIVFFAGVIGLVVNCGLIVDSIRAIDRNTVGLSETPRVFRDYLFSQNSVMIAFYVAIAICTCALIVGRNERTGELRILAVAAVVLGVMAYSAIYFAQPIFQASALYSVIQLMAAVSVGVCAHSYTDEMKLRSFGIFHFATTFSIVAVVVSLVMSIPVLRVGTFSLPERSWSNQIEISQNARVLYLGDAAVLPGRSVLVPGNRSFSLTSESGATLLSSFTGPASSLDGDIRDVYSAILSEQTTHGGFLLARLSVGSVAVPSSRSPESTQLVTDTRLLNALDRQSDLIRLRDRNGLVVYRNASFAEGYPLAASVGSLSPTRVFELRNQQSALISERRDQPINPLTLASIALSLLVLVLSVLWPRRHKLISNRSLLLTRAVSRSHTDSEQNQDETLAPLPVVDLEQEHLDHRETHPTSELSPQAHTDPLSKAVK